MDTFTLGNRTYAVVTGYTADGIQLIDLTDPASPSPGASLADTDLTELDGPVDVDTFTIAGRTYAMVTALIDDGVQILQLLTEADRPPAFDSATYNLTSSTISVTFDKDINHTATDYSLLHIRDLYRDDGGVTLADSTSKTTADRTLTVILDEAAAMTVNAMAAPQLDIDAGAVTDTDGNQIEMATDQLIDTVRPFVIYPISSLADGALGSPTDVAHFGVDGRHYAIVSAERVHDESGIHIVNVTDPYRPYRVATLYDNATLYLDGPYSVDTFQVDDRTYAAVAGGPQERNGAVQLINVTDPAAPIPISQFAPSSSRYHVENVHAYRSGEYAYLMAMGRESSDDYVWALNVTDPAAPVVLDTVESNTYRIDAIYHGHPFETGGHTYWLVGGNWPSYYSLSVINATDPTDLEYVSYSRSVDPPVALDVFEAGGLPYAVVGGFAPLSDEIRVVNLTDPTSLSSTYYDLELGIDKVTDVGVFGLDGRTYALVTLTERGSPLVAVYDVNDPVNVRLAAVLNDTAHTLLTKPYVDTFLGPDGHTYALAADRTEDGLQILRFDADGMDDEPPIFVDASYRYDGLVTINFGEPLSSVDYTRLHIRDAGDDTGGISLDNSANRTVSGNTVTMTIDQSSRDTIENMGLPQLDIGPGAVADIAGNPVRSMDDRPLSLVRFVISQLGETATPLRDLIVYESGGHHYAAGATGSRDDLRIQIRNVSDTAAPVSVGDVSLSASYVNDLDYYVQDGHSYLVAAAGSGLAVYDVTDPSNPAAAGTPWDHNLNLFGVSVYGLAGERYAVILSDIRHGTIRDERVRIVNITDPDSPTQVGEFARHDDIYHLKSPRDVDTFVVGDRTYAAVCSSHFDDLQIQDVTDPTDPTSATTYYPGGCSEAKALTLGGGPWLAVCGNGLHLLDVSDPYEPVEASRIRGTHASPLGCSDISAALQRQRFIIRMPPAVGRHRGPLQATEAD